MSEDATETIPEKVQVILFPLSYRQVELPKNDDSKREILREHNKQWVLINDSNCMAKGSYLFARVSIDNNDNRCYYTERPGEDGSLNRARMHYNALEGLLVPGIAERIRHDFE